MSPGSKARDRHGRRERAKISPRAADRDDVNRARGWAPEGSYATTRTDFIRATLMMTSCCCRRGTAWSRKLHSKRDITRLCTVENHDAHALSRQLHEEGFATTSRPLLTMSACRRLREQMPKLFRGEFETGIYPDEWHWREGISRPDAAREMCNAWKSSLTVASVVLNEELGGFIAKVMGWDSVRIAQDDLVWKPPSASPGGAGRIDTVGFHQDSAYISTQFDPYDKNSVTLWMALDDADEETGCVEYAAGSHHWRPILHRRQEEESHVQNDDNDSTISDASENSEISTFHSSDESSYRDGISIAAGLAGVSDPIGTIRSARVKEGHAILHHQCH